MYKNVTPEALSKIIETESRPVMLVCVNAKPGKKFEDLLKQVPDIYLEQLEILVADIQYLREIKEKFQVFGTPSIVLYHLGKEKDTFLGQFGLDDLISFLEANLGIAPGTSCDD